MKKITPAFLFLALLCTCSLDDVKISENYIERIVFDIDPIEINIKNNQSLIYIWTEPSKESLLKSKKPDSIVISYCASLSGNRDLSNWAEPGFKYTVTAENGDTRDYEVQIDTDVPRMYSFDNWNLSQGPSVYYVSSSLRWESGNAGIAMALAILEISSKNPENYPTRKTEDSYRGNAVLMETLKGGMVFGRNIRIISGNFFLGKFNAVTAIDDELAATELGYIYPAKPKSIKGYYKYKEGSGDFIDKNGRENKKGNDSCSMNAWLYRSDLPGGKDTILTVRDVDESNLVVAKASQHDCSDTGGKFKEFELEFEYKSEPDFKDHRYKLGVTFASSKYGDLYSGKIGSRLIVDEIEIVDY
jgi:hypothetical protein